MSDHVIVWDIETIPDLKGFAAANSLHDKTDAEIREAMGDKFPRHIYHSIVCIGALIARRESECWAIEALGAPHVGNRTEKELIQAFVDKIAELKPQLVTFNGNSFDLPVLRYRASLTASRHPGYLRGRISTDTPMTQSTFATSSLRFHHKQKLHCTSFAE